MEQAKAFRSGLSREQLEMRRLGITASEVAAIVGLHPYSKPINVYLDKIGEGAPFEGNVRSRWGEILEEPIRRDYENRHDCHVETVGTLASTERPWMMATPDGLVFPRGAHVAERGMEIKVHSRDAVWFGGLRYGQPGTDEVPDHELIQCTWNMGVTGLRRWDLVPFLDGAPADYTIDLDADLLGMLIERAEKFRRDHVLTMTPPDPDGSEAYDDWQSLRFKGKKLSADVIELAPDDPLRPLIVELRDVRSQISDLEARRDEIGQVCKNRIAEHAGIRWIDERGKPSSLSWKRNRPGIVTDWKEAHAQARQMAALLLSAHRPQLERARLLAQAHETDDVVREIGEAVNLTIATLEVLSSDSLEKQQTRLVEGNRPFTVPHHWGRNRTDKTH